MSCLIDYIYLFPCFIRTTFFYINFKFFLPITEADNWWILSSASGHQKWALLLQYPFLWIIIWFKQACLLDRNFTGWNLKSYWSPVGTGLISHRLFRTACPVIRLIPGIPCWGWPRRSACVPLCSSADQDGSDPGGYLASSLSLSPCQSLVRVTQPAPRGGEVGLFWPYQGYFSMPMQRYRNDIFGSSGSIG